MSSAEFRKGLALKDLLVIGTILISFGGFYALTNHRLKNIELMMVEVKMMRETQIRNESKLEKLAALEIMIDGVSDQVNTIRSEVTENTARSSELMAGQRDRIYRTEIDRWILKLQRVFPDQSIPEIGK